MIDERRYRVVVSHHFVYKQNQDFSPHFPNLTTTTKINNNRFTPHQPTTSSYSPPNIHSLKKTQSAIFFFFFVAHKASQFITTCHSLMSLHAWHTSYNFLPACQKPGFFTTMMVLTGVSISNHQQPPLLKFNAFFFINLLKVRVFFFKVKFRSRTEQKKHIDVIYHQPTTNQPIYHTPPLTLTLTLTTTLVVVRWLVGVKKNRPTDRPS